MSARVIGNVLVTEYTPQNNFRIWTPLYPLYHRGAPTYLRLYQLSTKGVQAIQRSNPVRTHEAAIVDYVSGQNGSEAALQTQSPSPRKLTS
jgi:hypothetical protein